MDLTVIKHKILAEVIVFVRMAAEAYQPSIDPGLNTDKNKAVLTAILRLTKNFLMVLDERKAPAYKLAIIKEYLEYVQVAVKSDMVKGVGAIDKDISVILRYLQLVHADQDKVKNFILNTYTTVHKFVDFSLIHAPLVSFWLQTTCTMDDLRKMEVLLLFCSKDEQAKIYAFDESLLQNKRIQVLIACLKDA